MHCPVCNFSPFSDQQPCPQCGWESGVVLGDEASARAYTEQQLAAARADWQARRYNPELVPALERDPFETWEEFAARLTARPWYVGQAILQKDGYDIETGRFPLHIEEPRDWAQSWLTELDGLYLQLSRDPARALYNQSPTWPVYLWVVVEERTPSKREIVLLTQEAEIVVGSMFQGKRIGHDNRYLDFGNGTVIDTRTGLQWMRCALGPLWEISCLGKINKYRWDQALQAAIDLNAQGGCAGYQDWRLPAIEELQSLVLCSSGQPQTWNDTGNRCKGRFKEPTICQITFPNTPCWFWSASPHTNSSDHAWYLDFFDGSSSYGLKSGGHHVRLVRGGQ